MPVSGKVLEDSIRLSKIRSIKLTLYVVQSVALVSLAFVVVFLMGDAAIAPHLHLPIASFLAVIVLLLLVTCIESFFFRVLEIKFARSSSARHLMAMNSMKRALIIAVITGVVALLLGLPTILNAVENAAQETTVFTAASPCPSFWSADPLELMTVSEIKVSSGQQVAIYIVTAKNYELYAYDIPNHLSELFNLRLNRAESEYLVNDTIFIHVPTSTYTQYYAIVNDLAHPGESVTMVVEKAVSHAFTGITSLYMVAFVVSNIAWIAYLIPIEKKYSSASIYK
jgi:hypothetical protein